MPTAIWKSRLRSGSAHCDLEVAVEVRQCPLGSGARGGGPAVPTGILTARRRRRRRTALIKSNNPHLARGEKHMRLRCYHTPLLAAMVIGTQISHTNHASHHLGMGEKNLWSSLSSIMFTIVHHCTRALIGPYHHLYVDLLPTFTHLQVHSLSIAILQYFPKGSRVPFWRELQDIESIKHEDIRPFWECLGIAMDI